MQRRLESKWALVTIAAGERPRPEELVSDLLHELKNHPGRPMLWTDGAQHASSPAKLPGA